MWEVTWNVKNRIPASWIGETVSRFEKRYKTSSKEISIAVVGNSVSRRLNKRYRQKDKPTNVLSFPDNSSDALGEIVLCFPVIVAEAKKQKRPLKKYFQYILVHGLLHLQGFDHIKDSDAKKMEKAEKELLKAL